MGPKPSALDVLILPILCVHAKKQPMQIDETLAVVLLDHHTFIFNLHVPRIHCIVILVVPFFF